MLTAEGDRKKDTEQKDKRQKPEKEARASREIGKSKQAGIIWVH